MKLFTIITAVSLLCIIGCSGGTGNDAIQPSQETMKNSESHACWGLWQFTADPVAGTLNIVPLRTGEMHVNVLPFLEPPVLLNLTLETLQFNGDIIEADIGLRHPFLGLTEFTGFDVGGILISNGSITGFDNSDLVMAGGDDTYLMNPDGLTRWWNPAEFPQDGTIFSYKDGLLGTPDSFADFNSTLNGYKFFCDDLSDPDDPLTSLDPSNRCMFSPGQKNIRHYTIHIGTEGLVFNYAIDASWQFPQGSPPWEAPDDFVKGANRPEAWNVEVTEIDNFLWNDGTNSGGGLNLIIDVWDHFDAGLNSIKVESPGNFPPAVSNTPAGGGEGYSTYQVDIIGATPGEGSIDILVEIECEAEDYGGLLPGENVTAYFIHTAEVASLAFMLTSPNGGEEWQGFSHHDITWVAVGDVDFVDIFYSKNDFADSEEIVTDYPNDGTYDWFVPEDPSETVKVKITESGGTLEDESDDYFTILESTCDFGTDGFTLEDTTVFLNQVWSHKGILVSKQDPVQRVFAQSFPNFGDGGLIFVFNAADPGAGIIATYDTGDLIYCNNDQAMWIDSLSEPGFDRIIYNNFGGGSSEPDYQLKTIDWDGSAFTNPQTLPKSGSIWNLCVTPDGDLILHNAQSVNPSFYFYDKSDEYNYTFMFQLQQSTCPFGSVGAIKDIVYNPALDAILLMCNNSVVSNGGQLFALSMEGELLFQDLDVLGSDDLIGFRTGIDIDLEDPACRIILYAGSSIYDGSAWIARYSWDLDEKVVYQYSEFDRGLCRGDLQTDGTLWATPDTGQGTFYKFSPPPDW